MATPDEAIAALQAEVQRLQAIVTASPRIQAPVQRSLADTRILQKLPECHGEAAKFSQWNFMARAYPGALDPAALQSLKAAAVHTAEITMEETDAAAQRLSGSIYAMLARLCRGPALTIVMTCPEGNGLEAWRELTFEYEPKGPSRFRGMLQAILSPKFGDGTDLHGSLEAWDHAVQEYEQQSGERLGDSIRCGVVTGHIGDPTLRMHLQLNPFRLDAYEKLRADIRGVRAALTDWEGPVPMDVSVVDSKGSRKGEAPE